MKPPRVLIADDQALNRKLTSRRLERLGFMVDTAENGLEAVEAWSREHYDLVFLDCHMPEMDGFHAAEEIRRREETGRHTPIVALTASASSAERDRCEESGMDECATKPISDAELNRILSRYVVDTRPSIDNGSRVLREMIDLYLREVPARMDAIRLAVAARDPNALAFAAHALGGSSGNVGATRMFEICGELEAVGLGGATTGAGKLLAQLESELQEIVERRPLRPPAS